MLIPLSLASFVLFTLPQAPAAGGDDPVMLDRSGIRWAPDFQKARELAKKTRRLLFIIPNTDEPGKKGDFGRSLENFRVGVLCDERVRRLLNRRFVPFYFHVYEGAAGFDAEAKAFVVKQKKMYGKDTQTFTGGCPLLFMSSSGKLVGEILSSSNAAAALDKLHKLLAKNAAFNRRSKPEREMVDPLAKAELWFDVGDLRRAKAALKGQKSGAAHLWRARIARAEGKWRAHRKTLAAAAKGADPALAGEVLVERARALWDAGEFKRLRKLLANFDKKHPKHPRASEAAYFAGLAHLHAGDKKQALLTFKQLVENHAHDAWVYRADWAYCDVKLGPRETWAYGKDPEWPSLLGRRSYLGWPNPEVARKSR